MAPVERDVLLGAVLSEATQALLVHPEDAELHRRTRLPPAHQGRVFSASHRSATTSSTGRGNDALSARWGDAGCSVGLMTARPGQVPDV